MISPKIPVIADTYYYTECTFVDARYGLHLPLSGNTQELNSAYHEYRTDSVRPASIVISLLSTQ